MSDPGKYRDVCFTSFLETPPVFNPKRIKYLAFQQESAPETGKLHWQGFAQSEHQKTTSAWQKALKIGNSHCEPRHGPVQEASDYCTSETWKGKDKGQVEGTTEVHGVIDLKSSQGKRNDLDSIKEALDNGAEPDALMEDDAHFGAFARHGKFFREYAAHKKRRKSFSPPYVTVLFGPSGSNKTRKFFDDCEYKDYWQWHPGMSTNQTTWFDGYTGQSNVLFDEFRGQIPYGLLLKLTDGYPLKLPIKGGFCDWSPTKITITSPNHPREWYPNLAGADKIDQLIRRINKVDFCSPPEELSDDVPTEDEYDQWERENEITRGLYSH